jgi:tRNA(fMet)-specific endonuclease VapC
MTYLVDTDYVVDYLKGQRNVPAILHALLPEGLALSIITFAEVYEGIYYGQNQSYYEQGLQKFLHGVRLLGITQSTARQFAILRGQLRAHPKGKSVLHPKDNYDLFIAATALQHNLTLVTRNIKDYQQIPQLKLYK